MKLCEQCGNPNERPQPRCLQCVQRYPQTMQNSHCLACGRRASLGNPLNKRQRHDSCKSVHTALRNPDADLVLDIEWEDDEAAQWWVKLHPNGATHEEIAEAFGVTRETIRKISHRAMAKLAVSSPELLRFLERGDMTAEAILDEWAASRSAA